MHILLRLYSFEFVILVASATLFFRMAKAENSPVFLWTSLSILISVITWIVFNWGILGCVAGQLVLFIAITTYRTLSPKNPQD